MKKITVIFLLISISSFSQIKVEQNGEYHVISKDTISNHNTFRKSIESSLNSLIKNNLSEVSIKFPEQIKLSLTRGWLDSVQEIDTITAIRMKNIGWIDHTNYGVEPSPPVAHIPFYGFGMITFKIDSILRWQAEYKFKRTKKFGKTIHEQLDIPFQFMPKDSIVKITENSVTVRTFANHFHGVKYYVNNKLEFDYSNLEIANPGDAIIYNYPVFRHTHTVKDLEPQKTYNLRVEGNTLDGSINFIEFEISTL